MEKKDLKIYEPIEQDVLDMEMESVLLAESGETVALSVDEPEVLYN